MKKEYSQESDTTRVTLFYTYEMDLYAFSENRDLIENFELTRDMSKFYTKNVNVTNEEYRILLSSYNTKLLLMNVLYDGKKDYELATTYEEDFELSEKCNKLYDEILRVERGVLMCPFGKELRTCFGTLVALRKKPKGYSGNFNTFNIFMEMYGYQFKFE